MKRHRLRALALIAWSLVLAVLVNSSLVASTPYSAWAGLTEFVPKFTVQTAVPQGWSFFTRDPQEPRITAYEETAGEGWRHADTGGNGAAKWFFGANREGRLQSVEMGVILADIGHDSWIECSTVDQSECLDSVADRAFGPVVNESRRPQLCGRVGIIRRQIIPWAWQGAGASPDMPLSAVVVEVRCGQA
ncbi:SdpA family antimicrobial peptide system protein [Nocardiopsis sp. YSL2]|uniref:SdpA family antimicrobial peptide system protein n=1 Tax=Nocardiopsis sp. YSL2 TaxID=2939492 RepID=UPI0026F45D49|nr:SdpA family antimicrobial peptide system protein [Nocardiopsis sp. YSL2]